MKFNKHLLAAAIVACTAIPAAAQSQWTGFYLGANAGYGWNSASVTTRPAYSDSGYFNPSSIAAITAAGDGSLKFNGFSAGLLAGYNFQHANFVFGGEFDFNSEHADASRTSSRAYPCCAYSSFTLTQTAGTDRVMTLRGRAGYAHGRWLVYGTAGIARANIKYGETFTDTYDNARESAGQSENKTGWVVGAGYEMALRGKWSFSAEFRHARFGEISGTSHNLTIASTCLSPACLTGKTSVADNDPLANRGNGPFAVIPIPVNGFTHTADLRLTSLRLGVKYRF